MPAPLTLLAAGLAAGIALRESLSLSWGACVALAMLAIAGLCGGWLGRRPGAAALAAVVALGGLLAARAHVVASAALFDAEPWAVAGRVVEAPLATAGRSRVLLDLDELDRDGLARDAAGRLQLTMPGDPVEPLLPGDRVRLRARLLPPHGFHEPDSPDPERRFAARAVAAVASLPDAPALARLVGRVDEATAGAAAAALRPVARLRLQLLALTARHLQGERRALIESLVLGERARITPALDDAFRRAGVTHVLSVSGLHLAIAGYLAFVVLRRLLLRITPLARRVSVARLAAAAAIPATGLYTVLTGSALATERACLASWAVLLGVAAGRPTTTGAALALAALTLLCASPLALYDPSLQLSFAAAIGTVAIGAPLSARLLARWLGRDGVAFALLRAATRLLTASTAALLATAPITAWYFAQVAPAGLLSNLAVVPLAEGLVLPIGFLGCAAAPWDGVAGVLLRLAGIGAAGMAALARWFAAHAPEGWVPAPTLLEGLCYFAAVAALALWLRGARGAPMALAASLAVLAGALLLRVAGPLVAPSLTVTFLDVGQGDAALVELADGRALLVDGGGLGGGADGAAGFDPGAQVIVPWLRRRGVWHLAAVVATHPHPDHVGGLAAVVAALQVDEVWTSGAASALPAMRRLQEAARARGVPVVAAHALGGPSPVEVLHPWSDGAVRVPSGFSDNDGSIVLRASFAGRAIVLAGDVERRAEARILASGLPLGADVLKAGHHCSATSSTEPLLAAVHPSFLVCSVGAGNRWGFPAPSVVERAERHGARVLRTDRDGAVTVRVRRGGALEASTVRTAAPLTSAATSLRAFPLAAAPRSAISG